MASATTVEVPSALAGRQLIVTSDDLDGTFSDSLANLLSLPTVEAGAAMTPANSLDWDTAVESDYGGLGLPRTIRFGRNAAGFIMWSASLVGPFGNNNYSLRFSERSVDVPANILIKHSDGRGFSEDVVCLLYTSPSPRD